MACFDVFNLQGEYFKMRQTIHNKLTNEPCLVPIVRPNYALIAVAVANGKCAHAHKQKERLET